MKPSADMLLPHFIGKYGKVGFEIPVIFGEKPSIAENGDIEVYFLYLFSEERGWEKNEKVYIIQPDELALLTLEDRIELVRRQRDFILTPADSILLLLSRRYGLHMGNWSSPGYGQQIITGISHYDKAEKEFLFHLIKEDVSKMASADGDRILMYTELCAALHTDEALQYVLQTLSQFDHGSARIN